MKMISLLWITMILFSSVAFPQSSQCIFMGSLMIHDEVMPPPCSADPPVIQLLTGAGEVIKTAVYNTTNHSYGVSVFSSDGFDDSDRVWFRIIYNCDTLLARTSGDEPVFIGAPFPTPPELRRVNLTNNRTPTLTVIESDTAWENFLYQYQLNVFDPDSDNVTYSFIRAPAWLSVDEETGRISGTPTAEDIGTQQVTVLVNDGYFRGTDTMTYTIHVIQTNQAPSPFHLLTPVQFDTLEYLIIDSLNFRWQAAHDPDLNDVVNYQLVIVSLSSDTISVSTADTGANVGMLDLEPYMAYAWSVFASDGRAITAAADTFFFVLIPVEDVKELPGVPTKYLLSQNYPNPFNPLTNITFQIPTPGFVTIKVYTMLGEEVVTLVNRHLFPGTYQTIWDAGIAASGVYYYRISVDNFTKTRMMMLIK